LPADLAGGRKRVQPRRVKIQMTPSSDPRKSATSAPAGASSRPGRYPEATGPERAPSAETFAVVAPRNNGKLAADLAKMALRLEPDADRALLTRITAELRC